MKRPLWLAAFCVLAGLLGASVAQGAGPSLTTLAPGAFREIPQNLNVNVVFIGFGGAAPLNINTTAFKAPLPTTYKAIHRSPNFYGIKQLVGNAFTFDYNIVMADAAYTDDFFAFLASEATPAPLTLFQVLYNAQNGAVDVVNNHFIDASPLSNTSPGIRPQASTPATTPCISSTGTVARLQVPRLYEDWFAGPGHRI